MKTISPLDAELLRSHLHLIEAGFDSSGNVDKFIFRGQTISGIGTYTWAGKPAASTTTGRVIGITNTIETNGVLAFFYSDGTNYWQIGEVRSTLAKIMASTVAKTIVGFRARATDFGITGRGILYCGNGSNMIVAERQLIFNGSGKRSIPFGQLTIDTAGTGTNGTHLSVGGSTNIVTFPANSLPVGAKLTLEQEIWRSTGTGTATAEGWFGTANVTPGSANPNTKIYGFSFTGGNKLRIDNPKIDIYSSSYVVSGSWGSENTTSSSDVPLEGSTNINTAADMYLSLLVRSGTLNDVWDWKSLKVFIG